MTPFPLLRSLCLAAALLTASCQAVPNASVASVGAPSAVVLTGRAVFPGYALRAVSGDVTGQATVSLVDATGVTRAAGVTDADGRFTLYQSTTPFAPQIGERFTLSVTKRLNPHASTFEAPLVSLRTGLLRTADGWDSYSGASVLVNVATTTLAKLAELDAALTPADLMGKVSGAAFGEVTNHPALELAAIEASVRANLTQHADPAGAIVHRGDVTISTAADLAALANVEIIEGELTISGDAGFTTFDLPALRRVTGYVYVTDGNDGLVGLQGLAQLKRVGGLHIAYAAALESLAGLEQLGTIDGDLSVLSCPELTKLADGAVGLVGLGRVGGTLKVNSDPKLTALGFPALESVGNGVIVSGNNQLTSLAGLERLTAITGQLDVSSLPLLADLAPLSGLKTVGGHFTLGSNPLLTALTPLSSLTQVGGKLTITGSGGLTNLVGLGGLTTVGGLDVSFNPELTALSGLDSLTLVDGDIRLVVNPKLVFDCLDPLGHAFDRTGGIQVGSNLTVCE